MTYTEAAEFVGNVIRQAPARFTIRVVTVHPGGYKVKLRDVQTGDDNGFQDLARAVEWLEGLDHAAI